MPKNWRLIEVIRLIYDHMNDDDDEPPPPKEPPKLTLIICQPEPAEGEGD